MAYPTVEDYTLDEGIDPTSTFGIYTSVLLQIVRQALPNSYRGMIIYSATTPIVTGAYAWHKRCLWIKTAAPNAWHTFVYDNDLASWNDLTAALGVGAINNADQIVDGTIPLTKLAISAWAQSLLQVNVAGNAIEFKFLDQVLFDGFVAVDYTHGYDLYLLRDGNSKRAIWRGVDPARFNFASVPISKLVPGSIGQSPIVNSAGAVEWSSLASLAVDDNKIIYKVKIVPYSASVTIDCTSDRYFKLTLTGDCTIAVTNLVAGKNITLSIQQDTTGGWTPTISGSIHWTDGTQPAMNETAARTAIYSLTNDGDNIIGALVNNAYKL